MPLCDVSPFRPSPIEVQHKTACSKLAINGLLGALSVFLQGVPPCVCAPPGRSEYSGRARALRK